VARKNKWLIGCGVGCGLVLLAFIVLSVMVGLFFRQTFQPLADAVESYDELVEAQGEVEEFVPPATGAIPASRMEVFLSVRESMREARANLDAFMTDFPPADLGDEDRPATIIYRALTSLGEWLEPMAAYAERRNRALLEAGMSPGEYLYIYALAYYSWLDHSPEDGPVVVREGNQRLLDGEDGMFNRRKVRRRYRRTILALLHNQLDALPEAESGREAWEQELTAEIARLEGNPGRIVWQDGLPPAIEASLSPYRDRLEATYSANGNCFEWPLAEGERWNR
jgi:hypothetical protein